MGRNSKKQGGLAGLEFALISPVLLTLFAGTVDISNALVTARRMEVAAVSIAEIATTSSVQSQALNVLTGTQAWQATTAAFALFPDWTGASAKGTFAITLSAVSLTSHPTDCTQNCSYTASVAWSITNGLGQPRLRACGTLAAAPNGGSPSYATLPAGNFGPTSLLVADISYTFKPFFLGFITGDIAMMHSGYVSPRINNLTTLVSPSGAGTAVICGS